MAFTSRLLSLLLAACLCFCAAAGESSLSRRDDAGDDDSWNKTAVLGIPSLVQAGEETVWHLNISNTVKAKYGHHKIQIFVRSYSRKETKEDLTSGWPDLYCQVTPCAWTNLTMIPITIPKDAFPSSARMTTSFSLFDSDTVGFSTWGDDSTAFNLTGGTATWSEWEVMNGWGAVAHWSTTLPCDKVPCARSCIVKHLDPAKGPYFQQPGKSDFKNCVEQCGVLGYGDYYRAECISANATEEAVGAASATTSTGPSSTGTTDSDAGDSAPGRTEVGGGMILAMGAIVWALQ